MCDYVSGTCEYVYVCVIVYVQHIYQSNGLFYLTAHMHSLHIFFTFTMFDRITMKTLLKTTCTCWKCKHEHALCVHKRALFYTQRSLLGARWNIMLRSPLQQMWVKARYRNACAKKFPRPNELIFFVNVTDRIIQFAKFSGWLSGSQILRENFFSRNFMFEDLLHELCRMKFYQL